MSVTAWADVCPVPVLSASWDINSCFCLDLHSSVTNNWTPYNSAYSAFERWKKQHSAMDHRYSYDSKFWLTIKNNIHLLAWLDIFMSAWSLLVHKKIILNWWWLKHYKLCLQLNCVHPYYYFFALLWSTSHAT